VAKSSRKKTVKPLSRRAAKSPSKSTVSRARASTPARATKASTAHVPILRPRPRRAIPIPSPLPTKHIALARPAIQVPARSMPPVGLQKRPAPAPSANGMPARGPLVVPEFAEAGVLLAITYSIRDGRRGEFFDLMRELKPLLAGIGGVDCTIYEDRSRPNYFMEVFRFKDESEFTAFDDKFHKDRKIAAIYALLDDIVEAEKSDFKIFERRL
jgi:hypothetical protein